MNFTKKRDVAIEFMKNIEDALILLSIPCIIFVPYLYISMLGYKEDNKIYTWIYGFLLILICCIIPAYLLYSVIKYVLMNIKISKISCKLPLTEKEMDEFAKNKTCEEIIMGTDWEDTENKNNILYIKVENWKLGVESSMLIITLNSQF